MLKVSVKDHLDSSDSMPEPEKRCCADLLRNASSPGLNYSERGFRQKLIDLLHEMGYYKYNNSVYAKDIGD